MKDQKLDLPWVCTTRERARRTMSDDIRALLMRPDAAEMVTDGLRAIGLDTHINFPRGAVTTPDFGVYVGPVLTLRYTPRRRRNDDNRMGHDAIVKAITPGDILVADEHECRGAIIGGNSAAKLRWAGAAALVVNGTARDRDEVHGHGLPTVATDWGLASGKTTMELTAINDTINFHGVTVAPDDVAVVNRWGMVLIPATLPWGDLIEIAKLR